MQPFDGTVRTRTGRVYVRRQSGHGAPAGKSVPVRNRALRAVLGHRSYPAGSRSGRSYLAFESPQYRTIATSDWASVSIVLAEVK